MQCEMMGCKKESFNSLSRGPGTYIPLCSIHYDSVRANLGVIDDEQRRPIEGNTTGMDEVA